MTKKRDGKWACFASKGGCDAEFTDEELQDALDTTPPPENAPQGTTTQARGTPEEDAPSDRPPKREYVVATDEQIRQVLELIQESSNKDATHAAVLKGSAVNSLAELNPKQAEWWIETLKRRREQTQGNGNAKKGRK